jgi:hypothetical protein
MPAPVAGLPRSSGYLRGARATPMRSGGREQNSRPRHRASTKECLGVATCVEARQGLRERNQVAKGSASTTGSSVRQGKQPQGRGRLPLTHLPSRKHPSLRTKECLGVATCVEARQGLRERNQVAKGSANTTGSSVRQGKQPQGDLPLRARCQPRAIRTCDEFLRAPQRRAARKPPTHSPHSCAPPGLCATSSAFTPAPFP